MIRSPFSKATEGGTISGESGVSGSPSFEGASGSAPLASVGASEPAPLASAGAPGVAPFPSADAPDPAPVPSVGTSVSVPFASAGASESVPVSSAGVPGAGSASAWGASGASPFSSARASPGTSADGAGTSPAFSVGAAGAVLSVGAACASTACLSEAEGRLSEDAGDAAGASREPTVHASDSARAACGAPSGAGRAVHVSARASAIYRMRLIFVMFSLSFRGILN